jgi:SNF2 family DNA or RNA helicase
MAAPIYSPVVKPMAHQRKALELSREKEFFAYFMDTRTGKSKVVIDDVGYLYAKGLIDCAIIAGPNGLQRNWKDQIVAHIDPKIVWHCYMWERAPTPKYLQREIEAFKARTSGLLFFIVNMEAIGNQAYDHIDDLLEAKRCYLAIDESHRIGDPKTLVAKCLLKLGKKALYRRALSGTPDGGDPVKLFSQYRFLSPSILDSDSLSAFKAEYCQLLDENHPLIQHTARKIASKNPKMHIDKVKKIIQIVERDREGRPIYRNLDKLDRLTRPHVFRVKKADCFDLPRKTFDIRYVELTKRQQSIYDLVSTETEAEFIHQKQLRTITTAIAITRILRGQQIVGNYYTPDPPANFDFEIPKKETIRIEKPEDNPRLQAALDIIEEGGRAPTVIWTRFRPEIDELVHALQAKYGAAKAAFIDGRVQGEVREKVRKDFLAGKIDFLVIQTRAGIGFDLYRAETVIYYSNTFSAIDRVQSEDRTDSIQRKHPVAVFDIQAIGTVDKTIIDCQKMRKDIAEILYGGNNRVVDILKGE